MKKNVKSLLMGLAGTALLFTACNSESSDNNAALLLSLTQQKDNATYVLMNIPYSKFYAADAEQEFDSVSSATAKAMNGGLTYGNYYSQPDSAVLKGIPQGVTFPVRVTDESVLEGLTEITDDSPSFDLTISGKGGVTTTRYTGKQNLYKAESYSYYKLSSKPAVYKELSGSSTADFSFGKLSGSVQDKGTLYINPNSQGHHLTWEIALALDENGTALSTVFTNAVEKAKKVTVENETEVLADSDLNALIAAYATTSTGKVYALPILANYWRGTQFGADYSSSTPVLDGKTITKLTFVTTEGAYSFSKASIYDYTSAKYPAQSSNLSFTLGNTLASAPATTTALNEAIVQANAYIDADESENKATTATLSGYITQAKGYLSDSSNTSIATAKTLITSISNEIKTVKTSVTAADSAFTNVTGTSGEREYKGLFNPVLLKSEYDSIWTKYVKQVLGTDDETTIATAVSSLKSSISQPLYGQAALDAGQGGFCCELIPEDTVLKFSTADSKYTLTVGEKAYTYTFLGTATIGADDNWAAVGAAGFTGYETEIYKASGSNNGEFTYLVLLDDTPETTYHIEFRYGSDLTSLYQMLTGKYALWLAAGIPTNADATMIENVIRLFVTENLAGNS